MMFSIHTHQCTLFSLFIGKIRFKKTFGRKKDMGFTLIEVLIVIAILGTLAGIAMLSFIKHIDTVRVTRAMAEIKGIEKEILLFSMDRDRFPNDLWEIGLGNMLDPYGNPYQYQPSTFVDKGGKVKNSNHRRKDHNLVPVNTDYDLFSMGSDGKSADPFTAKASRDDVVRANNGLFIGLVSAY